MLSDTTHPFMMLNNSTSPRQMQLNFKTNIIKAPLKNKKYSCKCVYGVTPQIDPPQLEKGKGFSMPVWFGFRFGFSFQDLFVLGTNGLRVDCGWIAVCWLPYWFDIGSLVVIGWGINLVGECLYLSFMGYCRGFRVVGGTMCQAM